MKYEAWQSPPKMGAICDLRFSVLLNDMASPDEPILLSFTDGHEFEVLGLVFSVPGVTLDKQADTYR